MSKANIISQATRDKQVRSTLDGDTMDLNPTAFPSTTPDTPTEPAHSELVSVIREVLLNPNTALDTVRYLLTETDARSWGAGAFRATHGELISLSPKHLALILTHTDEAHSLRFIPSELIPSLPEALSSIPDERLHQLLDLLRDRAAPGIYALLTDETRNRHPDWTDVPSPFLAEAFKEPWIPRFPLPF